MHISTCGFDNVDCGSHEFIGAPVATNRPKRPKRTDTDYVCVCVCVFRESPPRPCCARHDVAVKIRIPISIPMLAVGLRQCNFRAFNVEDVRTKGSGGDGSSGDVGGDGGGGNSWIPKKASNAFEAFEVVFMEL